MLKISPQIKGQLPEGMMPEGGFRSEMGVNMAAPVELWRKTLEILRQRYPHPQQEASKDKKS